MKNSKDSALVSQDAQAGLLTKGDIATLTQANIVPHGTPHSQIMVFAKTCRERGLSPFSKEIYLVGYSGKYSVIVGINGFRRLAAETQQFAGCDDAKYDLGSGGKYKTAAELKQEKKMPTTCTVTVYRIVGGQRVPFTHTAVFSEFSSGKQKWQTMPFQMIAKVAEAFALRKGFSDRLAGLNIPEEQVAFEDAQIVPTASSESTHPDEIMEEISNSIAACNTVDELTKLYRQNSTWQNDEGILEMLSDRRKEIEGNG